MPLHEAAPYATAMRELAARADALDADAVRRVVDLVGEVQAHVTSRLAILDPTGTGERFSAAFFREYLTELDRVLADVQRRMATTLGAAQRAAMDLGADGVDAALAAQRTMAVHLGLPTIDPAMLEVAQGFTADLITGLTATMKDQIVRELRLGALGARSPVETARAITKVLGVRYADAGPLQGEAIGGLAYRAEVITRTEIGRMQSLASEARITQAATVVPHLRKRWVAHRDRRTRPSHLALHGTTIPWDDDFTVGPSRTKAFGPRDPALPPEESIACRCALAPIARGG